MKENKIEKLILDLSAAWKCSPEEVVDRLNSMNESEINKLIKSMIKKFKNGGMIDCLRAGGNLTECKKCGGKTPIKAQDGNKLIYDRPNLWESTFGAFSDSTKHPRQDGKGYYTAEILPSGDTLTTVVGPYTTFTERRMEDGSGRFFDVVHKDFSNRYYDPKRKDEGWFRDPVPADTKEMFNNIRNRFETPADTKAREMRVMEALINLMKASKSGGTK